MKIDLSKSSHILFFILFLPAVSFGAGWAFTHALPNWPFWLEGISPIGVYVLLYTFFERTAWHWPVFRALGIVSVPDLRGRWEGEQFSSYKGSNGKPVRSYAVLEVQQTFSGVSAKTYYYRWTTGHAASTFMEIEGHNYLMIIFESEPGVHHRGDSTANKGVGRLEYLPGDKLLIGTYFNTSGNHGELKLHRTGRKLLHRFTA
jgi:hypothetical protein